MEETPHPPVHEPAPATAMATAAADPIAVDPAPADLISKQLKLLLIEMLEHICLVAERIDMSDPTIRNSLDAFRVVLKNIETM